MAQVLIVDSDADYSQMMSRYFASRGHHTRSASLLCEGRAIGLEYGPEIVMLDAMLSDGSGIHAIRDFRALPSRPEVIVTTCDGSQNGAELAITSGAWEYWQKGRGVDQIDIVLSGAIEYRKARLSYPHATELDLTGIAGESPAMRVCFDLMAEAAASEAPVLLCGETGTGKELVAQAIHRSGSRAKAPFVIVDCASLPETLVESILLGHGKGAFTGACAEQMGLVQQAHRGTLFLDEIGELPLPVQKAFLRVLQEKRFRPVGAEREVSSDFRLIAATNRDLNAMVREGSFREDLYFRLRSLEILLPPLRERGGDAVLIAQGLLERLCRRAGVPGKTFSELFIDILTQYPWPGNVRELINVIERAVIAAAAQPVLQPAHLPAQVRVHVAKAAVKRELNLPRPRRSFAKYPTLSDVRDSAAAGYLTRLMDDVHGDVDVACQLAGISRSRLYALLRLHDVQRPQASTPSASQESTSPTQALS